MKIFTVIGSISKTSINKKLFEFIKPLAPKDFEFDTFDISQIPFFSQDIENNPPESVLRFKEKIINSDGILFITPEYNRSIPGVLKNAIDWASRPYASNIWAKKSAAVLGAGAGHVGAFGAQNDLKNILSFLGMFVMYQPEIYLNFYAYVNNGKLINETEKLYGKFLNNFRDWVLKNTKLN